MAYEFTNELNDAVYQQILKQLQEQKEKEMAAASAEALRRGISGSSYEARRQGDASTAYQRSSADALVNIAVENAGRLREERLKKEDQSFTAGQSALQRQWQEAENNKQRAWETGNMEAARAFEAQQADINRAWEEKQQGRQQRADLLNTGLGSVLNVGGQLGGMFAAKKMGLFGASGALGSGSTGASSSLGLGSSGSGLFGAAGMTPGATLGAPAAGGGLGAAGALGIGALGVGAALGVRNLADKRWGLTSKEATISSLFPGVGPATFGAVKGIGRIMDKNDITGGSVGKVAKKLFCFLPLTPVEMEDGSFKLIKDVLIGDKTRGGIVESVRLSLTEDGTIKDYFGVGVTASHAVREGDTWLRVGDSQFAKPVDGEAYVVSLVTDKHRIYVNGIEFADEHEVDEYEQVTMEGSLDLLNAHETAEVA